LYTVPTRPHVESCPDGGERQFCETLSGFHVLPSTTYKNVIKIFAQYILNLKYCMFQVTFVMNIILQVRPVSVGNGFAFDNLTKQLLKIITFIKHNKLKNLYSHHRVHKNVLSRNMV
jgi:hypothetical protein